MTTLIRACRTAVVVWAGLMAATLAAWWLGIDEGGRPGDGASAGTIAVIVIAFVKIRFVGRHFMELRDAPLLLRAALDAYVLVVGGVLVALYVATT